ncbi:unnamed protein product [Brassica rapa subsp. narinosa]
MLGSSSSMSEMAFDYLYTGQEREYSDLTSRLDSTEKNLSQTSKMLASTNKRGIGEISICHEGERFHHFRAEKNLKATKDNASLHQKNWSLSADNRKVVDNYQAELSEQISSLFNMVASCLSQQNSHLQGINKLSQSRLEAHNKAVLEMKKKVQASRDLYSFHLEAVQNIVRLHKANSNACLEEVSALTTSSACSIDEVSLCLVDFSFLLQGMRQHRRYLMNFIMLLLLTREKWLSLQGN